MTTTTQLDLLSRATDPATSRAAAESLDADTLNRMEHAVLHVAETFGVGGATKHDLTAALRPAWPLVESGTVSRRLTSLRRKGMVAEIGTTEGPTGRSCAVYEITAAGREALR